MDPNEFRERVNNALDECLRPREEVMMIRRIMKQRLGQSLGTEQLKSPLSLVDIDTKVSETKDLQGLHREYIEAVRRNLKARQGFAQVQKEHEEMMASLKPQKDVDTRILDLHLEVTKLRQRHDKLAAAKKYLDELQKQPAAATAFLDPKAMYKDCSPLPEMPPEMVNGFAVDHESADAEIQELLQRLQKTVLRSKLMYRRDKQRHTEAQTRDPVDPGNLSPEVKLHALNAVKNTLINWIESQLSKAGDEAIPDTEKPKNPLVDHKAQLAEIQNQYQRHLELRKEAMTFLAQHKEMLKGMQEELKQSEETPDKEPETQEIPTAKPLPTAYLLTPYVEKLRTLSREQKGLIQERSHINASLAKQQEDTKLALSHLAEESQLLLKFPSNKPTSTQNMSFGEATRPGNKSSVTDQLQLWLYAADSAKITTLETVVEKVEEGMISVDNSRQTLEEICKLLNVPLPEEESGEGQEAPEKDLWDPEGDDEKSKAKVTKKCVEEKEKLEPVKTIWEILDGNLGSINE
ncbi:uncharacterized protein BCR38DRAFT_350649 [Pseudomassariella vexata]|uniref:Uncharacterized protein n=1 Tax=Pseudomassariella vexata TaxID=1141098 RepID=A0A1Y2DLZ0_9PEZI|nr:uncharacterized protein BCR38DRAFT_350649 [Pseudomassariella vexata]ORY60156.1 hypothetical protein BCR38DRAFT_350649 [Pseudomassariella vexata]